MTSSSLWRVTCRNSFRTWIISSNGKTAIASKDIPNELAEAEQIKQEIDMHAPYYAQIMEYGQEVVEGQEGVQYMFLREVGRPNVCKFTERLV